VEVIVRIIGSWHHLEGSPVPTWAAHLHGRDLEVASEALHTWHWWVRSPHGEVLAEGRASDRQRAEEAAEDEATAVHPPTSELIERLLS
jgi:hypothetical protein